MDIRENIRKLLESDEVSNYAIHKKTGIAQSTLSDLKIGKSKIGNMKLDVALKLNEYYIKNLKEGN